MTRLERDFFARDVVCVARDLLGQVLVRRSDGARLSGIIVEVEAYGGQDDLASHARVGRTARNAAMYGPPGHAYVYLIYGVHHCLNVVTGTDGKAAAVLIRALQPLEGLELMRARRGDRSPVHLTDGPGKLCQALAIDRRFDRADLCAPQATLFLEKGTAVDESDIVATPRVGVSGDETAKNALWRFCLRHNQHVSRRC